MKRILFYLVFVAVIAGCAGSPLGTGWEAEANRDNMLKLNINMTKAEVISAMGKPYKTEMYEIDGKHVEFWLYLTEGKSINDSRLMDGNFTPLAFESGILEGWGRNYYENTIKIQSEVKIQ